VHGDALFAEAPRSERFAGRSGSALEKLSALKT
jgi:hypothetical protein